MREDKSLNKKKATILPLTSEEYGLHHYLSLLLQALKPFFKRLVFCFLGWGFFSGGGGG